MDETPVVFDLPYSTTLDLHGTSTVNIRTTGHEKTNFIVILACMAVGSKLPPVCIFKLKKTPRELFPQGVYIRVNEKGWCNEEEMLCRFNEKQTNLAVIPGGLTCKLQSLGVAINKSFKANLRQYYNTWMNSEVHTLTPAGKIKRPSYATVTEWVRKSWRDVDISIIQSGQDEVRNVDELGGDDECYDSDYRETDSNNGDTDSEVSNNDSDEVSNDSNDKIDSDINEYEEQEISDYENEFDRLNLFVTQVFLNNE
ncbi:pogo transposable element with KRAB domain [Rhizophagus clarus]|uniref:Pogo transposable element with KRAB domain n=1 Tax=Rhizophagus clarus TaxID=94130 RepID=A0A8H3QL96_9GLOM|nr:pogo transposable element with KRAB domain [Rhizophagus clarus]